MVLEQAIQTASGRNKRRLANLNIDHCKTRVAFIDDDSALRELSAFRALENELLQVLEGMSIISDV